MTDLFSTDTAMADAFASAGIETGLDAGTVETAADTGDDDREPEHAASATAMACESLALHGATPARDEFDSREVWDRDDASTAIAEAFRIMAQGVAPDGFQLADERESLLWGFVNMLDAQTKRLDRAADKLLPDLRDLQRAQDGTEIKSRELELVTDRAQNLTDRRDAFEIMRDEAAEAYRADTGSTWRPRRGSHTSQTGNLTSAAVDARDFMRARKNRETVAHLPEGTLIAIAGGGTSPTPPPSSPGWTRPARNTPTWCSCMAADPASRRSRRAGPSATACTRSSASPIGTGTDAPHPSAATTTCSISCRKASSPSPVRASPTIWWTRPGNSASRFSASRLEPAASPSGPRCSGSAARCRSYGPPCVRVRRPRARFAQRARTVLRTSASAAAPTAAAQTPLRLRSAGFSGVDLPIANAVRFGSVSTAEPLFLYTRRTGSAGIAEAAITCDGLRWSTMLRSLA